MLLANFDMTFLLFEGLFRTASLLWLEVEATSWCYSEASEVELEASMMYFVWLHVGQHEQSSFIAINLGLSIFSENLLITRWG